MARVSSIDIPTELRKTLSAKRVWSLAREVGFVQRRGGKINPFKLVWTLALGFGSGRHRTISSLRRAYELTAGVSLVPSAFYDRFTASLVALLRQIVTHLLAVTVEPVRELSGALAQFGDLMIADATVLRLREQLERWFPACRTNHTKAAAKLHVVMSVTGRSGHTVRLSGERRNDGHMLRVGPWVRDRLLLFDLGYYSYRLFDRIRRNGGFFISRLKSNGNPLIVSENRKWRGRAITVAGQRLQEVLGRLQREVLDVEIEVSFYRRKYAGVRRRATTTLRLVAVRNDDTGEYHVYVTNVPADRLAASEVALAYRARWEIELLFRTWKSDFRLDELPSQRREVVEALLYSAIITMIVTHKLLALLRARAGAAAERVTHGRVATVLRQLAQDMLLVIASGPWCEALAPRLSVLLLHEALDPHLHRPLLIAQAGGNVAVAA